MNENNYGRKLKNKRKNMKLTQQQAANKIGISRSYYSDIENGRKIPNGKLIFSINNIIPLFKEM